MGEYDDRVQVKPKSEEILDAFRQRNSDCQIIDVEEELVQIIIFQLHDTLFGIYGSDAKEVLEVEKITVVPGSPGFILGIVNVRGDVESVIDLNRFLQLPPERESVKARLIIAQNGEMRSGIRVAAIRDVVDIPKSSVRPAISTLGENIRHYVIGETLYNGQHVTMLDMDRIFSKIVDG
ncbi:MAG: chemotaxis protein CheW [Gallionella sp.]|nr:chemotaxis protein CheW [Gallionella sp.]